MTRAEGPPAATPVARDSGTARLRRWVQTPWAAALLGVLCFLNTIGNDFVYDDIYIIRDNPRIRSLTNVREIWLADWWHPKNTQILPEFHRRDRLYRPLTLLSFAVDYDLFGVAAGAYHAVNIAWHALACGLLWWFAWRLLGDRTIATLAALWFAVHPIHCEAVANIVGRAEVMAATFLLGGLIVLLPAHGRPGVLRGLGAAGLFFLALLCKETAVCYAPVALLALWLLRRRVGAARGGWRFWPQHGVLLLLPLAAYLPLRHAALSGHLLRDRLPSPVLNPLVDSDFPERFADAATVLGHYVRLLVSPRILASNYGVDVIQPEHRPELMTWVGLVSVIAGLIALAGALRRRDGPWHRLGILAAMLVASYILISNSLLIIGVSVAERLMYWPSAPAAVLLAVAVVTVWRRWCQPGQRLAGIAPLLRICGVLLLASLGLRALVRNVDWTSNQVLFSTDVETFPQSVHLNNGMAREYLVLAVQTRDRGQRQEYLEQGLAFIEQALARMPNDFDSLYVKGHILADMKRPAEALAVLDQALLFNPFDKQAQALLAQLRNPQSEDRIAALETALATQPADYATAVEVSRMLLAAARPVDALKYLEPLAAAHPDDVVVLELLAEALAVSEQFERSSVTARRLLALQPDNWRMHTLVASLIFGEDPEAALHHAREAHRLAPDDFRTNWNLAEGYAVNKQYAEAIALFERMRAGLPADDPHRTQIDVRLKVLRDVVRRGL
jgi:tetratricopeptide (TPR) repeat protein